MSKGIDERKPVSIRRSESGFEFQYFGEDFYAEHGYPIRCKVIDPICAACGHVWSYHLIPEAGGCQCAGCDCEYLFNVKCVKCGHLFGEHLCDEGDPEIHHGCYPCRIAGEKQCLFDPGPGPGIVFVGSQKV